MAGRAVALADIDGLYQAFGFHPNDTKLSDHIAAELSFLSLLLSKESYAWTNDLTAQACLVAQTVAVFLKQHLGRWADALAQQIGAIDAGTPYYALAALLAVAVQDECRRRRVRPRNAEAHVKHETA